METFLQDLKFGVRMLRKNPGFAAVAVITLALGIGANTAVFSVVYGVLLRPLPYPEADRVVTMKKNQSRVDMDDVRQRTTTLEQGGAVTVQPMDFTGGSEPVAIHVAMVDAGLFHILGVKPLLGRAVRVDEDRIGGPLYVMLSHAFWQQHLGSDPAIVGKAIPLSGKNYTVVGVMPASFMLPGAPVDGFLSLRVGYPEAANYRGVHFMRSYWRLKPGVTLDQAQAEMTTIDSDLAKLYPAEDKERHTQLIPVRDWMVGETRTPLLILFAAVGFVLLVSCANFANLLVTRALARAPEMVVRSAMGAARVRLVRQMVTESVLVAMLGGLAGLVLAKFGIAALLALKPANLPRFAVVAIDWRVFLFALTCSLLTGIVFGLVPALAALRSDPADVLKEAGRGASAGRGSHRLRKLLIVSEVGLALLLLIGAGLLIRTFWLLRTVDPGFVPDHVVTMNMQLPESRYAEIPKQTEFRSRVLEGLNALPGIRAAMVSEVPFSGDMVTHNCIIEGRAPLPEGAEPEIDTRAVAGDYLQVMKIPVRAGRTFNAHDNENAPPVAIINDAMARQFFPKQNPLGARIRWARWQEVRWMTIVGVVGDVKHYGLDHEDDPAVYTPYSQSEPWRRWMSLVIRTSEDTAAVVAATKNIVWAVDAGIPIGSVHTMTELMTESTAERQFNMLLLGMFAGLALALAAVGVYGLSSYSVTQRTREIGIRMALGANRGDVLRLIVVEGLLLATAGVGIGLIAALALTRVMSSMLYGVSARDPLTFVAVAIALTAVATVACYLPARRGTRVDPIVALRYE